MRAAVYARVSTERQGRDQTIDSQLEALRGWAASHGHELKHEHVYIDEGYSGSRLDRPALDRLRDAAREGEFDVVAVYSPDRLARRYAYQVLLLEEFRRAGCDVEFVHRPISDDPHDQLLLPDPGGRRRVRAGRARRAIPPGQAPEGPRRALDRRPGPLRLSLHPGPRRRPGPPGDRRGGGRGGPDALPLADRRADDRPPDPQAARRRPVAAAVRQAALVALRGASDPLRPGLHRDRLRQPPRIRRAPQAALDRPEGGDRDMPQIAAARGVDRDPGPGHHRGIDVSGREVATGPQLGPLVPEQQAQRLSAPVPAHPAGGAAWRCSASRPTASRARPCIDTTSATARTRSLATASVVARRLRQKSRSSTRPSGVTSRRCSRTRRRWPPGSKSWRGSRSRRKTAARRSSGGRRNSSGSAGRSRDWSTPTRPRRSTCPS